jgi:hypothetical protein
MQRQYKTAQGKIIDFEALQTSNEAVIAVGNTNVNARGDELGPGGKVIKSRNEVMKDYYKLNTPVVTAKTAAEKEAMVKARATPQTGMAAEDADMEPELTEEEIKALKGKKKGAA